MCLCFQAKTFAHQTSETTRQFQASQNASVSKDIDFEYRQKLEQAGRASLHQLKISDSVSTFRKLVENSRYRQISPNALAKYLYELGRAQIYNCDLKDAEQSLTEAFNLVQENDVNSYCTYGSELAFAISSAGDYEKAAALLTKILAREQQQCPRDSFNMALTHRSIARAEIQLENYPAALDHLAKAVNLLDADKTSSETLADIRILRAVTAAQYGQIDDAKKFIGELSSISWKKKEDKAKFLTERGYVDFRSGNCHKAVENYRRALKLSPGQKSDVKQCIQIRLIEAQLSLNEILAANSSLDKLLDLHGEGNAEEPVARLKFKVLLEKNDLTSAKEIAEAQLLKLKDQRKASKAYWLQALAFLAFQQNHLQSAKKLAVESYEMRKTIYTSNSPECMENIMFLNQLKTK